MLIPFGILSSAGGVGEVGAYELIATEILTANTPSVTFSSLATHASTYKHLQVRITTRSSRASNLDGLALRLNADSGANYSQHFLRTDDTSITSGAGTSQTRMLIGIMTGASSLANLFGGFVVDLLDPYSTTKNKTVRTFGGRSGLAGTEVGFLGLNSGAYYNTSALTSITFIQTEGANNLVAGSRFSLYGVKG